MLLMCTTDRVVPNNEQEQTSAFMIPSSHQPFDPIQTNMISFPHQVGGHGGIFSKIGSGCILKPLLAKELAFYSTLWGSTEFEDISWLRTCTPKFYGVWNQEMGRKEVESDILEFEDMNKLSIPLQDTCVQDIPISKHNDVSKKNDVDEVLPSPILNEKTSSTKGFKWITGAQTHPVSNTTMSPWSLHLLEMRQTYSKYFIMLEDLSYSFQVPCILDCKIGVRHYDDDATDIKKRSQTLKAQNTTSSKVGLRMTGMQFYNQKKKAFEFEDKYFGRNLKEQDLIPQFRRFFHDGIRLRADVIQQLIPKLTYILDNLKHQNTFKFYSSSLLIIYEGSSTSISSSDNRPLVDVRMIDFAHTQLSSNEPDQGYILGVSNLIDYLQEILKSEQERVVNSAQATSVVHTKDS